MADAGVKGSPPHRRLRNCLKRRLPLRGSSPPHRRLRNC
uniref:Uncharacterized protein n=1 Tax=uncultured Desulfobacterium sp. TaxID=201089 RepID=E1YGS3_9BACT|nr:unknown protein [uncultured Desulfobacterium sp.]